METSTPSRTLRSGQHLRSGAGTVTESQIRIKNYVLYLRVFCSWPKKHLKSWSPVAISIAPHFLDLTCLRWKESDEFNALVEAMGRTEAKRRRYIWCFLAVPAPPRRTFMSQIEVSYNTEIPSKKILPKMDLHFTTWIYVCLQTKRYSRSISSGGAAC